MSMKVGEVDDDLILIFIKTQPMIALSKSLSIPIHILEHL
jgi:hypothetical protein